jgi:hypothetical protein
MAAQRQRSSGARRRSASVDPRWHREPPASVPQPLHAPRRLITRARRAATATMAAIAVSTPVIIARRPEGGSHMRRKVASLAAGAALISLLSGVALAGSGWNIPNEGVFWACYDSGGNVKFIDYSATQTCPKGWIGPVSWSQTGLRGADGVPGRRARARRGVGSGWACRRAGRHRVRQGQPAQGDIGPAGQPAQRRHARRPAGHQGPRATSVRRTAGAQGDRSIRASLHRLCLHLPRWITGHGRDDRGGRRGNRHHVHGRRGRDRLRATRTFVPQHGRGV